VIARDGPNLGGLQVSGLDERHGAEVGVWIARDVAREVLRVVGVAAELEAGNQLVTQSAGRKIEDQSVWL
jgi:hypothetical protein